MGPTQEASVAQVTHVKPFLVHPACDRGARRQTPPRRREKIAIFMESRIFDLGINVLTQCECGMVFVWILRPSVRLPDRADRCLHEL